ncbi:hypothetical protein DEVEQU_01020 [Devosia equisanguinis]|uniref:Uncharacterized protein n=1 Tax=Devosia equisanguinis TaxID=2490941 RepID=A0A3S4CC97_9HYPH|nr:hypothetical protein DEVEQU_01020 [Devosia equisanguinis]
MAIIQYRFTARLKTESSQMGNSNIHPLHADRALQQADLAGRVSLC